MLSILAVIPILVMSLCSTTIALPHPQTGVTSKPASSSNCCTNRPFFIGNSFTQKFFSYVPLYWYSGLHASIPGSNMTVHLQRLETEISDMKKAHTNKRLPKITHLIIQESGYEFINFRSAASIQSTQKYIAAIDRALGYKPHLIFVGPLLIQEITQRIANTENWKISGVKPGNENMKAGLDEYLNEMKSRFQGRAHVVNQNDFKFATLYPDEPNHPSDNISRLSTAAILKKMECSACFMNGK